MKETIKNLKDKLGKRKFIIIIVAIIIAIIVVPTGIKCIVNEETPAQLISDVFTPTSKQIIGKWQGDSAVTAYEFFDNGTFESYISTFSYKGTYEMNGNKITLKNSSLNGSVEYKVTINGNNLSMKLVKENGEKAEDKSVVNYTKVDTITMQSFTDIINSLDNE